MTTWDDFACSDEDVGRINTAPIHMLKMNVKCPEMVFNDKRVKGYTMSYAQCALRIEEDNPCARKCKVAKKVKKILDEQNKW